MKRITNKDLEAVVYNLNRITDSPAEPWTKDSSGKLKANVGNYHLDGAYGGWTLHRMSNESGGVTTPLHCGYVPKRELMKLLDAFVKGIYMEKENKA